MTALRKRQRPAWPDRLSDWTFPPPSARAAGEPAGSRWMTTNLQPMGISGRDRESQPFRLGSLLQLPEPRPINPPPDEDLGMLAIADVAAENPCAPFPQDRHIGAPGRRNLGGGRYRAPGAALAGLARLATG